MVMHVHRISDLELIRALWHSLLSKDTNSHFIVGIHIWSQKLLLFGIGTLQINYPKYPSIRVFLLYNGRDVMYNCNVHTYIKRKSFHWWEKCEFLYLKGSRISSYSKWSRECPLEKGGNDKYKRVNLIKFQLLKWA